MKNFILLVSIVVVLASCDEAIQLDLDQTPSRLVIEGNMTDVPGRQFVRITRSAGFYQSGVTNRISNATVTVTNDDGEVTAFTHNPGGNSDSVGYYLPPSNYFGEVGKTYTLNVLVDGETYQAADKLLRVTKIDSIQYQPNRFRERDMPSDGKYLELLMFATEPQDAEDNYLFLFYRNDSLVYTNDTDVYFFNDYGVGGRIEGFPSPVYYAPGDKARVEMYSISRNGFLFYNDLVTILNSDGGMFSPPPANPRSNISNGALGFFQVSSMTSSGVDIPE